MRTIRMRRRGGALLAVLWLSAALAAIAFSIANTVRGETERTSTAVDGLRSYYLAKGALQRGILYMVWSRELGTQATGAAYYSPGRPVLPMTFPGGEAVVEIIPETAKLDINAAPPEELHRLLLALGVEPVRAGEIAAAIHDWRAPVAEGGFGLYDAFYASQRSSFRARHASFEEIEELLLVKGMTPDLFYGTYERAPQPDGTPGPLVPRGGLLDCVSVFGSKGPLDVNTAHPAVLAAAGLPPGIISGIVERRRVMPFQHTGELSELLQAAGGGRLRVGGNTMFTVRATARQRLPDGQLSDLRRTVAVLVKLLGPEYPDRYHVLRWYDNAWSH